ncbi:hypothetical protein Tco_1192380 [Tanacetum coccineum]
MIPLVFSSFYNNTYLKDVQAFHAKQLPISSPDLITPPAILTLSPILPPSVSPSSSVYTPTPPQIFEIGKCSNKIYLKHHEKQVEDILNYLDELYLHRIERRMTSTSETPAITLDAIRQLIADLTTAVEAQTAAIASNPNNLTGTPAVKTGNYKEFISCQPFSAIDKYRACYFSDQ